ncbi:MAG: BrnA antitoxin family protein [Treponema sp.]|nr:BrnA antitoxin family protein [Treponema sp.]
MNSANALAANEIAALKKRAIDFSDIPELTPEQAKELYPKNWKPRKQAISVRIDTDTIDWLKEPGEKGYLQRLNAVLRWARMRGCPIANLT